MSLKNIFLVITLSHSLCYAAANTPTPQATPSTTNTTTVSDSTVATNPLEFQEAWTRPSMLTGSTTSKNNNTAVYFTIVNNSKTDYKLVNVSSDAAGRTELHKSFEENGITKMVKVDNLVIPAGSKVEFKPGGTHVMLFELKRPLKVGDKFNVSLYFDDNTQQNVEVEVRNNAAIQY